MSTFPTDQQLPNTNAIIRQTDCSYSFNKEAVTLTLKFLGDSAQAVGLAASYRSGTRIKVSDLTSKFTELRNVLPTSQLEATGKVTSSTSTTKTGSAQVSISVSVPYKAKISIGGSGGDDDPERRIIVTWSEKSTNNEYDLGVYAGEGDSASECNAGNFEAWKNEKNKNIDNYKNFMYTVPGEDEPVALEGRTLELAKKWYKGIECVMRAYPEVIRTTQYLNYKADEDKVDDTLISQIEEDPDLYYRDQTPEPVWKSKFANYDWLKASYDVQTEATEYQKLWNITVTESWIGCNIDEQGTWDDDLYGADGTRWNFAMKGQGANPSGKYNDGTPIQPTDVNGKKRVKRGTFQDQDDIKTIDLGGDFYGIDQGSFSATQTRSIRSVTVPALETILMPEINFIGDDAFNGAANLKSINVKDQVTYMGERVFKDCSSMAQAIIEPSIYDLPASTFEGCSSLDAPSGEPLTVGGLITTLGECSFKDCTSLTAIKCANSVTSIGDNAFDGDVKLASFSIPTNSTGEITIGDEAFKGCEKLADIELPVPTITLGTDTFDGAFDDEVTVKAPKSFLTNLPNTSSYNYIYPSFITSIADNEWQNNTNLKSAALPTGLTSIGQYAFSGCTSMESVTLPDTLTTIGRNAFESTKLTEITIPDTVTSLSTRLFQSVSTLLTVEVGSGVATLGYGVFYGCSNLESVTFKGKITTTSNDIFKTAGKNSMEVTFEQNTIAEVQALGSYPWSMRAGQTIHCSDGDITIS